ncbi:MAG: hypothetical protein AB1593_05430 [Pseudomonadota bacterium]
MKTAFAFAALLLLAACGSGGPPPPDWKTDATDLIERYKKHALLGENTLAERYFQQAITATGSAGRVAETARLWLVRCATRRAMLIDDPCMEFAELARTEFHPADAAYHRFLMLDWNGLDASALPAQHRDLLKAVPDARPDTLQKVGDPLSRLLDASLLVMRKEADDATLALAAETASAQGWRQPLLTYLKLRAQRAESQGNAAEAAALARRIRLVEDSLSTGHK